jgi:hypothetical protein
MEIYHETVDALGKFFFTIATGMILAGIVSFIIENKNLYAGIVTIALGFITMTYGLYFTNVSGYLKRKEK